jgi:hypothetical protein
MVQDRQGKEQSHLSLQRRERLQSTFIFGMQVVPFY